MKIIKKNGTNECMSPSTGRAKMVSAKIVNLTHLVFPTLVVNYWTIAVGESSAVTKPPQTSKHPVLFLIFWLKP